MIPKIIHYCWFGGNEIPRNLKKCMKSWEKFCPDYEIKRWDETNFDIECHPFVKKAYEKGAWAFVSDYARLKIIYDNGGIYLDTDVELKKNLDFLLVYPAYIGIQQNGLLCTTGLGFGAEKNSLIVYKMMQRYNEINFAQKDKLEIACPWMNDSVIREQVGKIDPESVNYHPDITIYPPCYFDPISTGETKQLLCADTVSIHHYAATWLGKKQRYKRAIAQLLGPNIVNIVKKTKKILLR